MQGILCRPEDKVYIALTGNQIETWKYFLVTFNYLKKYIQQFSLAMGLMLAHL